MASPRRSVPRRPLAVLATFALACATLVALAAPASAAVVTTDLTGEATADDLANRLAGEGVAVSNVSYTGNEAAAGSFVGGDGIVGLDEGVILSSGNIADVVGSNQSAGTTTSFGTAGDADLTTLVGASTFDAAVLEFDFVPTTSQVQFNYVFSSEEYNEFVNLGFNDVFGFFVNGTNCALVGEPPVPVSIDTINGGSNASLYIDNTGGQLETEMDGLTVVLTCVASVTADDTNHMKLAIADTGDTSLDSAVFLGQSSLIAVHELSVSTAGEGSGTVTSDPAGIDCGEDCSEGYEEGTSVTLTATADEGSVFDGWSGPTCEGTGPCELTIDDATQVTATFSIASTCPEGSQCDEGEVPPGGTLTTVQGPAGDPVSPGDPFAIELTNLTSQTIDGTIVEEPCDGTQEGDALCSTPRIGGSAGNFRFTVAPTLVAKQSGSSSVPVTLGELYFDKTVLKKKAPVRIFYQKAFGDPVIELRKCTAKIRTECFNLTKLKSGDQIVSVPFKDDPRVTRG